MDDSKKNAPERELNDEELDEVSGGIQAGRIIRESYVDEFGNRYVRDKNGEYRREDQMGKEEQRPTYL